MRKSIILVPDLLEQTSGRAHAVRVDEILHTSCFAAVDRQKRAVSADAHGQLQYLYRTLGKVLRQAGAAWGDVARICHYAPPALMSGLGELVEKCLTEVLPDRSCAVTIAPLGSEIGDAVLKAELVAHIGHVKRPLATRHPEGPAGVRIGQHIYLSSRVASSAKGLAPETSEIYGQFNALLAEAHGCWNDVLRVRQYVAHTDIDFNDVRKGREAFLPAGRFLSTSVASLAAGGARPGPALAVDLEAIVAPKVTISTSAVPHTPGTPHAIDAGRLVHFQAQIAEEEGKILYPGDIAGQTAHILGHFTEMMAAAGLGWDHLVASRAFCKDPAHLGEVRRLERQRAGNAQFAQTDLVARFFDPDVLVEMEIMAHR